MWGLRVSINPMYVLGLRVSINAVDVVGLRVSVNPLRLSGDSGSVSIPLDLVGIQGKYQSP
jgi:hypothetical protein